MEVFEKNVVFSGIAASFVGDFHLFPYLCRHEKGWTDCFAARFRVSPVLSRLRRPAEDRRGGGVPSLQYSPAED